MKVGLFIPCFIDQFYPQVGMATVKLLQTAQVDFEYPGDQTCCGQPMANAGCIDDARPLAKKFVDIFCSYDKIVCPSASCVAMVRHHYDHLLDSNKTVLRVRENTLELCEFLVRETNLTFENEYPAKVGLHMGCHGLRDLGLGSPSENMGPRNDLVRDLLAQIPGLEIVEPKRTDECCGFGGTFATEQHSVSAMMGHDRVEDFVEAGADLITSTDMSCLMHLEGLIRRNKIQITTSHLAEILAEAVCPNPGRA